MESYPPMGELHLRKLQTSPKDKALFYQACSTLIAHTQTHPDICRAYSRCVKSRVRTIAHLQNLNSYFTLIQPVRSPSLEIVRIGGAGDGGYCMLLPPPAKARF